MDVLKFLKEAKKKGTWTESVEASKSFGATIPDGSYVAQLTGADFGESQTSGRPQIVFAWLILEGEQADQTKYDYFGLDGERSLEFLAARLRSMGIDPEEIEDLEMLPDILQNVVAENQVFRIQLKTQKNSDFQNTRVLKPLPDYESGGDNGDDDGPFEEKAATEPKAPATPKPAPKAPAKTPSPAKPGAKAKQPEPEPEPEQPEGEEGEVDVEIGMKVTFTHDAEGNELAKPLTGSVKAINDNDTLDIKVGLKTHKGISVEYCEISDDNGVDN